MFWYKGCVVHNEVGLMGSLAEIACKVFSSEIRHGIFWL